LRNRRQRRDAASTNRTESVHDLDVLAAQADRTQRMPTQGRGREGKRHRGVDLDDDLRARGKTRILRRSGGRRPKSATTIS
jgi:hypothetical protein